MASPQLSEGLPPVLSTEEVAELLRLNPKTVLAMARDGRLPGHRLPGCRKLQYLTSEILATVAEAPGIAEADPHKARGNPPTRIAGPPTMAEVDPCDVWGAAPSVESGENRRQRCLGHWINQAQKAGFSVVASSVRDHPEDSIEVEQRAGYVEIDGLLYVVIVGPRQRNRYVDDEGEERWGLIDAVWVEPVIPADRGTSSGERARGPSSADSTSSSRPR